VCETYERRGRYKVERLIAKPWRADAKLTDLPERIADCPKARSMRRPPRFFI
jgi:hypothetical protein